MHMIGILIFLPLMLFVIAWGMKDIIKMMSDHMQTKRGRFSVQKQVIKAKLLTRMSQAYLASLSS
ncbi:MAG: hypothetical protein CMF31_10165 [Kordiimonas sp.]|nr:hypothetical protein [Kordiimonas sp.]|tara:strand:- start:484 stop:678 length:195 start_codon:yes stop_codon:yes gene_type:complete